jgi:hypothetical protein
MSHRWNMLAVVVAVASAVACKPDLGAPISLIAGPRVLAVRGMPAEGTEGTPVTYDFLAVDENGAMAGATGFWALCSLPRPPSETNSVSSACLDIPDAAGPAATYTAPITAADPSNPMTVGACSIFGPVRPPLDPMARQRDPDVTGGFYEPVRLTLAQADQKTTNVAFDLVRIKCRLPNAPADVANTYFTTYLPNNNPTLSGLTLTADGGAPVDVTLGVPGTSPAAPAAAIAPGAHVALEAAWPADAAETFPVYDIQTVSLVSQREAMRVSWYASAGAFDHDVTGRAGDDAALTVDNGWTAPDVAGPVHVWLVLLDNRGGVDFAEATLNVGP